MGVSNFKTMWVGWPGATPATPVHCPLSTLSRCDQTTVLQLHVLITSLQLLVQSSPEFAVAAAPVLYLTHQHHVMPHTLPPPCCPSAIDSHLEVPGLQSSSTGCSSAGVYVEEGPDRDALTEALARENYLPVYLDPRTVRNPTLKLHYKPY